MPSVENYVYEFGKKKENAKEPHLSEDQAKQIENVIRKYLRTNDRIEFLQANRDCRYQGDGI